MIVFYETAETQAHVTPPHWQFTNSKCHGLELGLKHFMEIEGGIWALDRTFLPETKNIKH